MKTSYALLFFVCATAKQSFSQCSAEISFTTNGMGAYTFTAANLQDTTSGTQYYWLLNSDTLPADSSNIHATVVLDSNGTYQICLYLSDTAAQCSFDTCVSFVETNAEYLPLLDSVNIWHMFENNCVIGKRSGRSCPCTLFATGGDTIVNNILYKKLVGNLITGFIREDIPNRKVYYQDSSAAPEILLYDFSMDVGDSMEVLNFGFYSNTFRLDSIKTASIFSVNRKVFFLSQLNVPYQKIMIWIEGIGNLASPVYPFWAFDLSCFHFNCPSAIYSHAYHYSGASFVTCFEHSQRVYYDSCAFMQASLDECLFVEDECSYYNICFPPGIPEIPSLSSFTISPNPAVNSVSIQLDVKNSDDFTLSIMNLEGKTFAEMNLGLLSAGLHRKEINTIMFTSGFYLVECKTSEGSLRRKLLVQK